jgi:cytochrome P450
VPFSAWAIWVLSQHDDILLKVRTELVEQGVLTGATTTPTYEQLQKCVYLEAVIKETLRLYPPAGMARYTSDISETYGGYTFGGAVIYISPYVMHRQESVWERACIFCPERWLGGDDDDSFFSSKFISFSRGPRDCLGKYFAMLEAKIAVSAIVQTYDMVCVDPNDCVTYKVTSCPRDGAKVQFSQRT